VQLENAINQRAVKLHRAQTVNHHFNITDKRPMYWCISFKSVIQLSLV